MVDQIIVINDGSTDNTVKRIPNESKITLIAREVNRGKGYSLNEGFREAAKFGSEIVVTLDGDLQHQPELIPDFVEALKHSDIVIGKRKKTGSQMPVHRRLSNFLTSLLVNIKTGYRLHDSQSGFRGYRLNRIIDILPEAPGYEAETEILINASRKGLTVSEVEIPTIYTEFPSKMNYIQAIRGFLRVILQ